MTDIVGGAETPCSISLIIYIYMYVCIEMGARPLLSTTGGADECPAGRVFYHSAKASRRKVRLAVRASSCFCTIGT